jgi:hypothetical protein
MHFTMKHIKNMKDKGTLTGYVKKDQKKRMSKSLNNLLKVEH